MTKRTKISKAVHITLGLTGSLLLTPDVVRADEDNVLEEVHVTGTRIQRANMISASPIAQIDSEDILLSGTSRIEDLLKSLPQVSSLQNSSQSNGATGTATIDLRYLGAARTLVLLDSRRLPAGSPLTPGEADINQIPGALIDRVEILTGGASAAYGSDAMAGVVNFLLVHDFAGVKFDYQYSEYAHDNNNKFMEDLLDLSGYPAPGGTSRDGDTTDLSFIIGGNFTGGRGNMTAYATYRDIEPVVQSDRIHSACSIFQPEPGTYFCGGSSTIPEGRFTDFGLLNVFFGQPGFDYKVQGNEFVPTGPGRYNYGSLNYFQRPDERYTLGTLGHYEINEHVEAYTQLMYVNDRSVSQIAESGTFFTIDRIGCDNPFLSDQQFEAICGSYGLGPEDEQIAYIGRRNVEGGPRRQDLQHISYRGVFGLRGDINDTWRYDVYGQYAEVEMQDTYFEDLSITHMQRALDVTTDPATGEPVCSSVLNGTDPNCVPYNIFQEGGVTQQALDYISIPLFSRGTTDQTVISGYVAGNLASYGLVSPFAENGIALVLGAEYREENLDYNPDKNYRSGDAAGQGSVQTPLDDGFDVTEAYTELVIPLVEGKPWAETWELELGYRYSDYSSGETTDTYKIATAWAPIRELRLRASFQHATRLPNLEELHEIPGDGFFPGLDPCAGAQPERSFEDCSRTGVTTAQYGQIPQTTFDFLNGRFGGNDTLQSEESDTTSIGFLYWPSFVEELSISLDWYEIEIDDAISYPEPRGTLNTCLDTGDPEICALVQRSAAFGDLWIGTIDDGAGFVDGVAQNIGFEKVTGYDLIVDYNLDLGRAGNLGIHNMLSYIDEWEYQDSSSAPTIDCRGFWGEGCGFPTPELRNHMRLTWISPWNLTISALWRHFDSIDGKTAFDEDFDAYDYFDIAGIWEINDSMMLRAGVNNVTDEEPPRAEASPSIGGNGNTLPGMYDALGQYWFAGLTVSF
jgi:outer membrane receptor protein involved in Fe transport